MEFTAIVVLLLARGNWNPFNLLPNEARIFVKMLAITTADKMGKICVNQSTHIYIYSFYLLSFLLEKN